jgi:hypothetical protein
VKVLKMTVREYHRFQLKQYIYKLFGSSLEGKFWKFSEEGLFWFPWRAESVHFAIIDDYLMPRAAGIACSMWVCMTLTREYCDCLPNISEFWSGYYDLLSDHVEKNFSEGERRQIFSFLKAELSFLE